MDSNLEYCYGPHHIHEIVPNLTIIFLKNPVTVYINSGGVAKCLCLLTRGVGVKNLQNPVYVICVRPLKRNLLE